MSNNGATQMLREVVRVLKQEVGTDREALKKFAVKADVHVNTLDNWIHFRIWNPQSATLSKVGNALNLKWKLIRANA